MLDPSQQKAGFTDAAEAHHRWAIHVRGPIHAPHSAEQTFVASVAVDPPSPGGSPSARNA
jgi:hypothetical protein